MDVSERKPYADVIGRRYRVIGDVSAYGIKRSNTDPGPYFVALIPAPGIAGREVTFSDGSKKFAGPVGR